MIMMLTLGLLTYFMFGYVAK